jgi:phospholipid/cholesterol/gamma-HCH transport system ATP-binding protein
MAENIIEIQELHKSFGSHKVLSGVNLEVEKGKSLVILGGSGTGKSVLIKTIIGLMKPTSGKVFVDGINTANFDSKSKANFLKICGFLFQAGALFDSLNVEDNITFFASRLYNLSGKKKRDLAAEKLKSVGLSERVLKLFPSELSGGMQKRVSLARTICTDPEIIFFDEPTTGLDPVMSNVINELIQNATKKLGATSITITHDMNSARIIADKIAMIYQGKIIWQGTSKELDRCTDPIVNQFVHGRTEGPISLV